MSAKRKASKEAEDIEQPETPAVEGSEALHDAAADVAAEIPPPPRANNEVLPNIIVTGSTITKASDLEVKNYLATADFVCRQLGMQLADMWPEICKVARKNGEEGEKASKVSLSVSIVIDHSNLNLMDTKVTTSFSEKHSVSSEMQEDLRQTEFNLKSAA